MTENLGLLLQYRALMGHAGTYSTCQYWKRRTTSKQGGTRWASTSCTLWVTLDHFGSHLGHFSPQMWAMSGHVLFQIMKISNVHAAVFQHLPWRSWRTWRNGRHGRPWRWHGRPWVIPSLTECRVWGFHSTCCDQFLSLRLSTSFHFPSLSITFHHFPSLSITFH